MTESCATRRTALPQTACPRYDLARGQTLAMGAQSPASSGGDQALAGPDGWLIAYPPPKPFSPYSVGGFRNGVPVWSYPNPWPGLHASHEAPDGGPSGRTDRDDAPAGRVRDAEDR